MKGIVKVFGGIHALSDVNLSLKKGEVLSLVGENGAGKSTLMKILSGVYQKDHGEIFIDGAPARIRNPHHGKELGISIIYQELAIANDLTVMENIFLGSLPANKGFVQWKEMREKAERLLDDFGVNISPNTMAGDLSVAFQQHIEIIKALVYDSKILILDEPTAVLSQEDVKKLFKIIRMLKEKGVSIVYISHRMEEIFEISDRITVLKDGVSMGDLDPSASSRDDVIAKMIGRELGDLYPPKDKSSIGEDYLTIENITTKNRLDNISFSVRKGEIFGLAGLVGSGRSRLVKTICGLEHFDSGTVSLQGKEIQNRSLADAIGNGFGFVPENRKEQGLFVELPIQDNSTIGVRKKISNAFGLISGKRDSRLAKEGLAEFNTKYGKLSDPVNSLSGGNQQKVSIVKWNLTDPQIVIFDEPTRGVDVGAKAEIYKLINQMAAQGKVIIVISSELPEIIGICDRVGVMAHGKLVSILERDELDEHKILSLAV